MLKHGHRREKATSPTWLSWRAMVERCTNPGAADYPRYGGRGIRVCDRWRDFTAFLADMGERPRGTTLDRRDVNGHYERGNCRWATAKEQGRNKRGSLLLTFDGRTQCLSAWAEETGLDRTTLRYRLKKGWPIERALTTPLMSRVERWALGLGRRVEA